MVGGRPEANLRPVRAVIEVLRLAASIAAYAVLLAAKLPVRQEAGLCILRKHGPASGEGGSA